jgi:hypothetical protein
MRTPGLYGGELLESDDSFPLCRSRPLHPLASLPMLGRRSKRFFSKDTQIFSRKIGDLFEWATVEAASSHFSSFRHQDWL